MENFLLVGNGAREHSIAEAICKGQSSRLYAFMSANNPGIAKLAKDSGGKYGIGDIHSTSQVASFAKQYGITLAFPSPDAVLAAGVTDALVAQGIPCASPSHEAARLEWDKAYCKELLKDYKIPGSPQFGIFDNAQDAASFIDSLGGSVAVKPAGLTGGKGVKVTGFQLKDGSEAKEYVRELLAAKHGGLKSVILEEKLEGEEFSLQAFSDGSKVYGMPMVQDHKRAYEGDVGPNCYSADTEILAEDGWKTFDKLTKHTAVAIFQPRFRRIRFEKPMSIYWKKYAGKMVHFKHREIDLLVTPNHRMLVEPRKGRGFKVIEAQNWQGENTIPQTGSWIGSEPRFFRIPASKNRYGPKFKCLKIKFKDWAAFMGLFLSEGFVSKQKRGSRVYVTQSKNSPHFEKMRAILKRLPLRLAIDSKGFRFNSTQLAEVLEDFGYAHEKFIPSYIKNSKPDTIRMFLGAFCLGDGDMHRGQMRFCSSSKRMIGDIQELFLKTGKIGVVTIDKRTMMLNPLNKKSYRARPIYAIETKQRAAAGIRKKDVKSIDYAGYIGCVTVSTGFVVVRRNNRLAICGNTGGMGSYSGTNHLLPFTRQQHYDAAISIMQKTIEAFCKKTGQRFVGVLYGGFILTREGVRLLEYNSRFGDPEAMNVLALLKDDLTCVLSQMAKGKIAKAPAFEKKATVCKYLVPEGYPGKALTNQPLQINTQAINSFGAKIYYAAVYEEDGIIYTQSSRSVALVGTADTISDAERISEGACGSVIGKVWHRKDIGTDALVKRRIDHLKALGAI